MENETRTYKLGYFVGSSIRTALIIGTSMVLGAAITQEFHSPAMAKPVVQVAPIVKHKIVKHRIRRHKKIHHHYNIKLDNDKPDVYELESRITTLEERMNEK